MLNKCRNKGKNRIRILGQEREEAFPSEGLEMQPVSGKPVPGSLARQATESADNARQTEVVEVSFCFSR